tara:strand:- start:1563 stop:2063 length:501 start_codon:yes stop_codon:yes gene_type:complete
MDCRSTNGRVNIIQPDTAKLFAMSDKIGANTKASAYTDAMTGNWHNTTLSSTFFSKENMEALQIGLQNGVYEKSKGEITIGRQSYDELKTIMRSIFLQYAQNLSANIRDQVKTLNEHVLDYAVPQVYGEALSYMQYKRDVSTLVVPLEHPVLSKTNDKQLELKKFF